MTQIKAVVVVTEEEVVDNGASIFPDAWSVIVVDCRRQR
jgi:hypothetical protein